MELSELSLRVEKLEEIIQALAKWTNFNLNSEEDNLENLDSFQSGNTTSKNNPRFANVASEGISTADEDQFSIIMKIEENEDNQNSSNEESIHDEDDNELQNAGGEDLPPESNADLLSNLDEDSLSISFDGGENSGAGSDFDEPPKTWRITARATKRKYEALKVPLKLSLPPSEPFVSLRPLTASQILKYILQKKSHKGNDLKCPSNTRKFKTKTAFNRHRGKGASRSDPRPFSFADCFYATTTKKTLSSHIRSRHPATKCPKTFKSKDALENHLHKNTEKTFLCDSCPYLGRTRRDLNTHMKRSHKDPILFCYFCPWKGKDFSNVTNHMRIHTGEKPYKCPHCLYTSTRSLSLLGHVRNVHDREGAFQCPKCSCGFKTNGGLTNHLKSHGGSLGFRVNCGRTTCWTTFHGQKWSWTTRKWTI